MSHAPIAFHVCLAPPCVALACPEHVTRAGVDRGAKVGGACTQQGGMHRGSREPDRLRVWCSRGWGMGLKGAGVSQGAVHHMRITMLMPMVLTMPMVLLMPMETMLITQCCTRHGMSHEGHVAMMPFMLMVQCCTRDCLTSPPSAAIRRAFSSCQKEQPQVADIQDGVTMASRGVTMACRGTTTSKACFRDVSNCRNWPLNFCSFFRALCNWAICSLHGAPPSDAPCTVHYPQMLPARCTTSKCALHA